MNTAEANNVMQEANRIIEDFSPERFILYTLLFLVEIGFCFLIFKMI